MQATLGQSQACKVVSALRNADVASSDLNDLRTAVVVQNAFGMAECVGKGLAITTITSDVVVPGECGGREFGFKLTAMAADANGRVHVILPPGWVGMTGTSACWSVYSLIDACVGPMCLNRH
jgi:hypothetical protein